MAESLTIADGLSKAEQYRSLLPQIEALIMGEDDLVANLSNVSAALKETFDFWWVGFYIVKKNELVLGPFQGPVACSRIQIGKGVCGKVAQKQQVLVVPNVEEFPGHIACSAASKSEIVVPLFNEDANLVGVLDVDSDQLNYFDDADQNGLESLAKILSKLNWDE
ncbi:MAG: GAF domain-containing protein [Vicingaceae bacterium]